MEILGLLKAEFAGFLVGILSSLTFLYLLLLRKPRLEVSRNIACSPDVVDGSRKFRIKVVNRTRTAVIDVRAQLDVMYETPEGYWISRTVPLREDDPLVIGPYRRRDREYLYCYRFVTDELDAFLASGSEKIRFKLICRHAVTNLGSYLEQFYDRRAIVDGDFMVGDTFQIQAPRATPNDPPPPPRAPDGSEDE